MTLKQSTGISNRALIAIAVCFGLVDAFVLGNAWLAHHSWNLFLLSIPVAQCVLIAAWAATARINIWLRFGLPLATILVSWKMIQHVLSLPLESRWIAQWMLILIWVMAIVVGSTRAKQVLDDPGNSGVFWKNYLRIDLQTMMMATLAAGLAFALVQYGRSHWGWSLTGLDAQQFLIFNLFGFLTGIQAVSCLWSLVATRPRHWLFRACLHLTATLALSFLLNYLVSRSELAITKGESLMFWLFGNTTVVSVVLLVRGICTKLGSPSQSETPLRSN